MKKGYVYLLDTGTGKSIFKVGMTTSTPLDRLKQLNNNTSVCIPMNCVFFVEVENARSLEYSLHKSMKECRVNNRREYFQISINQVKDLIKEQASILNISGQYYSCSEDLGNVDMVALQMYYKTLTKYCRVTPTKNISVPLRRLRKPYITRKEPKKDIKDRIVIERSSYETKGNTLTQYSKY